MNVRMRRITVGRFNDLTDPFDLDEGEQVVTVEWDREVAVVTTIQPWHSAAYLAQIERGNDG